MIRLLFVTFMCGGAAWTDRPWWALVFAVLLLDDLRLMAVRGRVRKPDTTVTKLFVGRDA